MPNGSQGIFISYRRDDAGESAWLLRMCLERFLPGVQVFLDSESIDPGVNFRTTIEEAIKSSAVLLALIGSDWLTAVNTAGQRRLLDSNDVLVEEIALALRRGVRVIPVLVQNAAMPQTKDLPAVLHGLADLQAQSLDHRSIKEYQAGVRWIARAIERIQLESAQTWRDEGPWPGNSQVFDRQTSIADFAARIEKIRTGDEQHPPAPANAMATLRVFAQERGVDDLLRLWPASEDAGGFAPLDSVSILTLAAVDRSPVTAAELTVGLRRGERGGSGLTESIVHDLTAQRTVPDLAEFIAECKRLGHPELVEETLKAFVGSASRVSLDKALLYFELMRFQCEGEAKTLLERTLADEGSRPLASGGTPSSAADQGGTPRPLAGAIGQVGMVGALRHLSPAQAIVENWIDERMDASANWEETAKLVAHLLGNEPDGDLLLAQHVATEWKPSWLIRLCEVLAGAAHRSSPGLRLVRWYAVTRDWSSLASIIGPWYQSPELSGSFLELVADIVTGGADGPAPRPVHFFNNLAAALKQLGAPPKCRSELLVAAASHPTGRPVAEIAELLDRVDKSDRRRAAQAVNGWFARGLVSGEVETRLFTDYLKELKTRPDYSTLIFWAVRELTDPADPKTVNRDTLTGAQIGGIAVRIYTDGLGDAGFDLLERYLENEQAVTAADTAALVTQVPISCDMRDARWDALLGATIGRWADTGRRDEVRDELLRRGCRREAAAIMSVFQ